MVVSPNDHPDSLVPQKPICGVVNCGLFALAVPGRQEKHETFRLPARNPVDPVPAPSEVFRLPLKRRRSVRQERLKTVINQADPAGSVPALARRFWFRYLEHYRRGLPS